MPPASPALIRRPSVNLVGGHLLVKLVMIGDAACGKTALLQRWAEDTFTPLAQLHCIGIDFKTKDATTQSGKQCKLQIWDTVGQERFRRIATAHYRGAHGILLVYDICCRASLEHLGGRLAEVREYAGTNLALVVVGTKCDRELAPGAREVSEEQGAAFAAKHGLPFFEVSAKDNLNVDNAFLALMAAALGEETHGLAMPCAERPAVEDEQELGCAAACACDVNSSAHGEGRGVCGGGGNSASRSSSSSSSSSIDDDDERI